MPLSLLRASTLLLLTLSRLPLGFTQDPSSSKDQETKEDGYIGYRLTHRGDPESAIYETANTGSDPDLILPEDPDVYLNASVSVGLIDIEVDNITAKVNLDAKVLSLLHFSAGVDASIDRVKLRIENVSAKVELEARLENVVAMVDDVLRSIDLNPIIATLGQGVGKIVDGVGDVVVGGGESGDASGKAGNNLPVKEVPLGARGASGDEHEHDLSRRVPAAGHGHGSGEDHDPFNYNLEHNILYSVNNYQGNKHRNRRLDQNGDIFDEYLDNDGNEQSRQVVGYYKDDMTFNGHNRTIEVDGKVKEFELQYEYKPFPGIEAICWIYVDTEGKVVRTKVISEAQGGGTSTVSNDSEE
ncbi:hypothetical protein NCU08522 [Neurospora crassa OR74A]|uniref:Uncharacterized protein n=1 Tax=Neurospora crassa (strain ATCC 24698 / 74-OR23-1A / CBS 708.71 / DSM 1257 / FGSC 987) TaxID=367110 RepID=Q7SAV9_NEUCR|nr:hypothetical protein NCU08522 [Neurospora crassa OR74A]EAA33524.1 hypothetical protein NCU08522 [Neurospora crassa OR74A]|eukprot:XP_962760.1 hypothetical protein NCU08522 [Neurospora crassa OR74A]